LSTCTKTPLLLQVLHIYSLIYMYICIYVY
jgi:hypothetical protein